jgi:hypothetical protein
MKTSLMMILLLAGCGNGRSSTPNEQSLSDMSDLSIWGDGMQGFGAASGGGDGDDTAGDRDADGDADADADSDGDSDADTDTDADTDAACIDVDSEACFDISSDDCGYCIEDGGECYSGWTCEDFGMLRTASAAPWLSHEPNSTTGTTGGAR